MHATERKAADIAMSEVGNCVDVLQTLESMWPGASKCKELLMELVQQAKENLGKGNKPKSGHTPQNSVQLPSPTRSNHEKQNTPPKSQDNKIKVSPTLNGGQLHLLANDMYSLNATTHSTPSPPLIYMSPVKRAQDETVIGRPLTIHDNNTSILKRSQPASPEFGPQMQEQHFSPLLSQNVFNGANPRLPSPPTMTYLNDPRIFSQSQDFSAGHGFNGGIASNELYYSAQTSAHTAWGNSGVQMTSLGGTEFIPFDDLSLIQGFVPSGQMRAEGLWENVFNAEPRMFGYTDVYEEQV